MASDRDILPDTAKPINYDISIHSLEFLGDWSYQGKVRIALNITKPAKQLVLDAHQLVVHSAELVTEQTKTEKALKASDISYDTDAKRVKFSFDSKFPVSPKACLEIKFQGTMNDMMAGFYRSRYKPEVEAAKSTPRDDEYHYMFSTQFESCDARRTFPCFDEPNLKATFDFEIELPEDLVALSNMPEKEVRKSTKDGWKIVSFEQTPVMSTYLLAWAVGDFEYVEDFTRRKYNGKNLPVRVYTTRGLKEQARFALQNAHQVVDLFSEVFRIDYPLPKVDFLACHEFSHGAMENWGLVTYRTTAILFDEISSDARYKNRIAYVVAHELAHQWFGNLVTMDWWSELWLNEGFATWVGWYAVDHLYPEWNVWSQFVSESQASAFTLDSIRNSHAIEVPVQNALEIDQIFDHISYLKGSSVIRMLSSHLGTETFLLGVSNYLKAHKYSNATTNDLWTALSEVSKKDVTAFIDAWIRKIGFPVLTIAEEPGQITARQKRFLITGDVEAKDDETTWWIPLGLKSGPEAKIAEASALTSKEDTLRDIDDSFYKLNLDNTGFYRTNYPPDRLKKLGDSRDKLSVQDRIGLVNDAAALAQAGEGTSAAFLGFIEKFQDEDNFLVWQRISQDLANLKSIFSDVPDIAEGLDKFTLKLSSKAADKLGFEGKPDDDLLKVQMRALLLSMAGNAGHEGIITEIQRLFKQFDAGANEAVIPPNLRLTVFRTGIAKGEKTEYEAVKKFYSTTKSVDGKEQALAALGRTRDKECQKDFLEFLFSPAVAVQDMHTGAASLAANPKGRHALWEYVKANWEARVYPDLSGNMVVLERFIRSGLNKFATFDMEKDIGVFFENKDQRGFDRGLRVVRDTIAGAARYRGREEGGLREWLAENGYL